MSDAPPPAGWYPAPGHPGTQRYWDGESWSMMHNPPLAKAPRDSASEAAVTPASEGVCPVCGQRDVVQRLSAVIDGGTSATTGVANALVTRDGSLHWDQTRYSSSSVSALAARLGPPAPPHFRFWMWLVILWAGIAVGGSVAIGSFNLGGILACLLVAWIPALVATIIMRVIQNRKVAAQQADWSAKAQRLRSAYYCARDDVVFDGTTALAPEAYRARIFAST